MRAQAQQNAEMRMMQPVPKSLPLMAGEMRMHFIQEEEAAAAHQQRDAAFVPGPAA